MAQLYRSLPLSCCFLFFFLTKVSLAADCEVTIAPPAATTLCTGGQLVLTASSSTSGVAYQWQKNGVPIPNQTTNKLTVTTTGDYSVAVSGTSCDTRVSDKITITQGTPPAANFTFADNVCSSTSISFTATPEDSDYTYRWDFGDPSSGSANTSTSRTPAHTFISNGNATATYTVKLTVSTPGGCSREVTKQVTVKQRPDASVEDITATQNFTTPYVNCTSEASDYVLKLKNISSTKGTNVSYSINWGDGQTQNLASFDQVEHKYNGQRAWNLILTVTGENGCVSTKTIQVFNGSNPSLSVGNPGNTLGCAPKSFSFPISGVEDNSPATIYTFQFDDGTPTLTYTHANLPAFIEHTFLLSSCINPSKSFTLTASAINPCNNSRITVGPILISSPPKTNFVLSPQNAKACVDTDYTLVNTSETGSNVNNGSCNNNAIFQWQITPATGWAFKNGTSAASKDPVISFSVKGNYSIKLKATNSCATDSITKEVTVIDLPVSKFSTTLNPTTGCKDLEVKTKNESTGIDLTYAWTVLPATGYTVTDGTLTSAEPTFKFTTSGVYTVTLVASNACKSSTSSQQITVKGPPTVTLPAAQQYCGPRQASFAPATAGHAPVYQPNFGTITAYVWSVSGTTGATFVNSSTETSQHPTLNFPTPGTYIVTVKATNECGISAEATQTITIHDLPPAPTAENVTICESQVVTLTAAGGEPGGNYRWYSAATNGTLLFTGAGFTPSPNLTATTTFYVEAINQFNCASTTRTPVTVTVNKGISNNVITASGPIALCEGQTLGTLNGTVPTGGDGAPYPFIWQLSTDGVTFTDAPAPNTEQNYTPKDITQNTWFRRSIASQACPPNLSNVISVTFSPLPAVPTPVLAEVGICEGQRADVGVVETSGITYTWYEAATGGSSIATGATFRSPVLTADKVYYVQAASGSNCLSSSRAEIKVKVAPAVGNNSISGAKTVCSGQTTALLTGATPTGGNGTFIYAWESSTTSATASDFKPVSTAGANEINYTTDVLSQTTWFRRVVTSGSCSSFSAPVQITVDPSPVPPTTVNQVICENTKAILSVTGTGGGTYQWFDQATGGTALTTGNSFTTPVLFENKTYYVQVTNNGGCTSPRAAVLVTVNKNISNNTVSADQLLCVGATPAPLKGSVPEGGEGVYTFLWESSIVGPNTGFGPAVGDNTQIDYAPQDIPTATWFRRKVMAGPCAASVSAAVLITVSPIVSDNRISFPQSICLGNRPAPLTGTQPQGGDGTIRFLWESSTTDPFTNFTPADGSNREATYEPGNLTRTTWFRRTVISGGCSNTSGAVQITVLPVIGNNVISANQTVCTGDNARLLTGSTLTGGSGKYTFLWEVSTDGIAYTAAPGLNSARDYEPGIIQQTIWVRRTVLSVPCSESNSAPVVISTTTPITNNLIQSNRTICAGNTPALLAGNTPDGGGPNIAYRWEVSQTGPTGPFQTAMGTSNGVSYQPGALSTSSWFRRVVTSAPCLSHESNVVAVTVNPLPAAPNLLTQQARVCPGSSTTLTVAAQGLEVQWYDSPQGGTLLFTGASFPTPALTQTTIFYAQSVSAQGCASANRIAAKVEVIPPLANAGPDVTIIQGRTAPLLASGGVSYEWSPAIGLSSTNTAATNATPEETQTYTVKVTSVEGCVSEDQVTVTVLPRVFIPNVLTLNKDGVNDDWEILNIEKYPNVKVEVFNRWGTSVFSSKGYQTRWDGTFQGSPLPVAAYYYIITLDKGEEPISGSITIIN